MSKILTVVVCGSVVVIGAGYLRLQAASGQNANVAAAVRQMSPVRRQASAAVRPAPSTQRAFLDKYCVTCHNQTIVRGEGEPPSLLVSQLRNAGLELDTADPHDVGGNAEVWEKVVWKLRTGAMPPAGRPRPDDETRAEFVSWLETALDGAAASNPNPGRPAIHRLNRTEYTNAIRDLFNVEIDGRSLLPGDNSDEHGFDNNADILSVSPLLMERYLSAARKISRLVVGRPLGPELSQYRVHKWMMQDDRMSEDLPFGSRGGTAVPYYFPADGEYIVKIELLRTGNDHIRGLGAGHELDIRLDGALLKRFTVGGEEWVKLAPPESFSGNITVGPEWEDYSHNMDRDLQVRVSARAGRRIVGVSFVDRRWELEGVIVTQPQVGVSWSRNEKPDGIPAVASVTISGPFAETGPGDTDGRRKLFVCQPSGVAEEDACAKEILSTLARRAYRRPVTEGDIQTLLSFYETGRQEGSFDAGIQFALERLLVSPGFLFRIEQDPSSATAPVHRVSDVELASRLSFFLWSSIPDDALLDVAVRGTLREPAVLAQQVHRMIEDPRSKALVDNFVGQWLVVRNLREVVPDSDLFPDFDENLREAFHRETELFMESMLREDRSVVDVLNANYTFVNERLARHYQIPNVYGNQFRRVTLSSDERAGLLGHGSVLTVTSYANRTSPVLRGKWLLENFFGAAPPPPPPNIPPLRENSEARKVTSVRERLEEHRKNPACATCHARMDPLGFALENFDAVGAWRAAEDGIPIDASAVLPDGTALEGPAGVRKILLDNREQFVQTVTEKLLTYALGRQVEYYDAPVVRQITRATAADDYRWSSVILEIVKSMPFQMRRSES